MNEWKSESLDQLVPALLKAQMVLEPAVKDHKNPAFKSKYADLNGCLEVVNAALHPNGLVISQLPTPAGPGCKGFVLKTVLLHTSGQWLASDLPMDPDMTNPQKVGGCVTYARRYGLAALCGLTQEDDDGETANGRGPGHDYDRAAPEHRGGNGNGHGNGIGSGNGSGIGSGNGSGSNPRPPSNGAGLFAWAKEQGDRFNVDVIKWLDTWGRRENFPPKFKDWNTEQVEKGHKAAVAQLNKRILAENAHGDSHEGAATN